MTLTRLRRHPTIKETLKRSPVANRGGSASLKSGGLLPFVQLEFPFLLGPGDGSYVVTPAGTAGGGRENSAADSATKPAPREVQTVLILATVDAPIRRRRSRMAHLASRIKGRRAHRVASHDVETGTKIPRNLATVARTEPFPDETVADEWLTQLGRSVADREAEVTRALTVVNRAISAHRAAVSNPYVREVNRQSPHSIRLGYGTGQQLIAGTWTAASGVPTPPTRLRRRTEMLHPQEKTAAVLSGRDQVPVAEELVIRGRLDLDQGRFREAAFQLRAGLEALLFEVGSGQGPADETAQGKAAGSRPDSQPSGRTTSAWQSPEELYAEAQQDDLDWLAERMKVVTQAALRARSRKLDPSDQELLLDAAAHAERVLRRRRYGHSR